jgi:hypothetical protein
MNRGYFMKDISEKLSLKKYFKNFMESTIFLHHVFKIVKTKQNQFHED